ncbi:MAG: radical SAM protein [Candidatus Wallbacteria bacterium]|nr:radical SAM protein [Candidatus Wallbacteria bacterium]
MNIVSFQTHLPAAALLSGGKLSAIVEQRLEHFGNLGIPAASIFHLLDRSGISQDQVDGFVHAGFEHELAGKYLQQVIFRSGVPQNYKPLSQVNPDYASFLYLSSIYGNGICFYFSTRALSVFESTGGSLRPLDLQLQTVSEISDALSLLYNEAGASPEEMLEMFPYGGTRFYHELRDHFYFNPNGRVNLQNSPADFFKTRISPENRPDLLVALKKVTEDIFLHYVNYVAFVTGCREMMISGDFNSLLSSHKLRRSLPVKLILDELPDTSPCLGGTLHFLKISSRPAVHSELEDITSLAESVFTRIREQKIDYLSTLFAHPQDPILIAFQEAFQKCSHPEITFKIEDLTISPSGEISWLTFLFFIFGKDSTGYPYIVNHKGVIYLKKEHDWKINSIEFTVFRSDPILTIEFTNHCNFRCLMCDQSTRTKMAERPMGYLESGLFTRIVRDLEEFPVSTVTPFWLGESTLHDKFSAFLDEAFAGNRSNRLFSNLTLNTNGSLLDREKSETILRAAQRIDQNPSTMLRLHFSIDAAGPQVYELIHKNQCYERTVENIRYFLDRRRELGLQYPKVTLAFIVMSENRREAAGFLDFWRRILTELGSDFMIAYDWPSYNKDAIYFRRLDCDNQLAAENLHKEVLIGLGLIPKTEQNNSRRIIVTDSILKEKPVTERNFVRRPCPGLWFTPIVNWTGEVTVCCFDVGMELKTGDLSLNTLSEIWDSPKLNFWRLCHIRGEFNKIPRCAQCANLNAPTMKNADFVRYLLKKGLYREIQPFLERMGAGV